MWIHNGFDDMKCPECRAGALRLQPNGRKVCQLCGYILPDIKCATCKHRKRKMLQNPCFKCIFYKGYPEYEVDTELVNATLDDFNAAIS